MCVLFTWQPAVVHRGSGPVQVLGVELGGTGCGCWPSTLAGQWNSLGS